MRYVGSLLVCIFFYQTSIKGQGIHFADSIRHYLRQKPKFTGYLDGRNTFSEQARTNIFGAFGGASYAGRIDVGLSYYFTYSEPAVLNLHKVGTPAQDSLASITDYKYFSLRFSYMFYKSRRWEISTPVSFGVGSGRIRYFRIKGYENGKLILNDNPDSSRRIVLAPLEMGVDATYLITPWLVFSTGVGYRFNMRYFSYNKYFSGVYYRYGFGIRFGYIYRKAKSSKWGKKCCCLF